MILLKCSHCGHEIEVSDSMGGRVIRCARCGHALATPPAEPFKTEIGLPPIIRPPGAADDAATADHYGGEETLSPKPTARAVTFPFLAPAKEPNELGWQIGRAHV